MKDEMIRPILYKCIARSALAVTALLLWNRVVNTGGQLSLMRDGCFTAGALFLCLSWFSYLRLDGVTIHHLLERPKKKKKTRRGGSDIVDFADEHIVSFEELDEKERSVCSLAANLICAGLFLAVAAAAGILR